MKGPFFWVDLSKPALPAWPFSLSWGLCQSSLSQTARLLRCKNRLAAVSWCLERAGTLLKLAAPDLPGQTNECVDSLRFIKLCGMLLFQILGSLCFTTELGYSLEC